eukprot:5036709-Pleurochrysis_carterae.AAC.1
MACRPDSGVLNVDRNMRATTSEAGEAGNAVFALAAAQCICRSVQAEAAVRAPRLLMKFLCLNELLQRSACTPQSISEYEQSGDGDRQPEITAS